jgi:DNA-directed RNA polymerase subunit L
MSAVTATLSDKHCVVTIANETHTLPALLRS